MSISSKRGGDHLGPVASVQPFPHQVHQDLKLVKQCHRAGGGLFKDEENGCSNLEKAELTPDLITSQSHLSLILLTFFSRFHHLLDSLFQS